MLILFLLLCFRTLLLLLFSLYHFLFSVPECPQLYHWLIWANLFESIQMALFFQLLNFLLVLGTNRHLLIGILNFVQQATDHLFDLFDLFRIGGVRKIGEPIYFHLFFSGSSIICSIIRIKHLHVVHQYMIGLNKLLNCDFLAPFFVFVEERVGNHIMDFSQTSIALMT